MSNVFYLCFAIELNEIVAPGIPFADVEKQAPKAFQPRSRKEKLKIKVPPASRRWCDARETGYVEANEEDVQEEPSNKSGIAGRSSALVFLNFLH